MLRLPPEQGASVQQRENAHPDVGVPQHAVRTPSPMRAASSVRAAKFRVGRAVQLGGERRARAGRRLRPVRRHRAVTVEGATRRNAAGQVVGMAGRVVAGRIEVRALHIVMTTESRCVHM